MFQKTNYFIALFFVLFALQSCQKEVVTPTPTTITQAQEVTPQFSVTVENGLLNFPTNADYENVIEYLSNKDVEELAAWNESIGFSSLQSYYETNEIGEKKQEVKDELFASLLNEDKMIAINGNTIMVDLNEEAVYVLTDGETAPIEDLYNRNIENEAIKVFSTDVDVLDILDGDDSSLFQKATYCPSNNTDWNSGGYCNPNLYEWRMKYLKAGIYYALKAEYKGNSNGCENKVINLINGFATNKKKTITFTAKTVTGTSSLTIKPYSSTRRLKKYSMLCTFELEDNGYTQFVAQETITCD